MLTKNWYILQGLNMLADSTHPQTDLKLLDWDGQSKTVFYSKYLTDAYSLLNKVKTNLSTTTSGVLFGTGDTPASLDDYKLAGNVIRNIAATINRTYSYSEAQQSLKTIYTITNNNTGEITIKEVALQAEFYSTNGVTRGCIIDRTVLDTPVTIPAGGIGQVEYTITFNLPTAT